MRPGQEGRASYPNGVKFMDGNLSEVASGPL
jgi:hypothetical protein